ncbi:toll/interleukin-1 receptor domain-containing protein, partial [Halomonas sp. AOP7-C1-8]
MAKLVFSYSHADEELRNELEKHLMPLKRLGLIDTWHDRRITAGAELHGEINHHFEDCNIILLLVSPDFINSDYCYDVEVKHALERHAKGEARVIPV